MCTDEGCAHSPTMCRRLGIFQRKPWLANSSLVPTEHGVWRCHVERSAACNILQHGRLVSGSVIVWGGISLEGHTALHVLARGSLTALRFRDDILRPL
uniref:Uncharacterized protein n=1 Tax=Engystomops pustulosus TaxID=76066 RepID=A0AAV6YYM9_ENGPU|nr:hypothetical protein GDO81_019498 [Engystomops pustulosus]